MQSQNIIPVTLITGFLGSGKTTLLSALLKQEEMANAAIVINEFGEVGLDHALIENSGKQIIELQNGCICCTIKGDLTQTLTDLQQKMKSGTIPVFDRLLIETTGLADPIPIIHTLMTSPDLKLHYTLDGVITLVDAANGEHTLDTQLESVKQAALAERIILTKTDLVDEKIQTSLIERLHIINPAVSVIQASFGNVAVSELLTLGTYNPSNKTEDVKEWLAAEKYGDNHHHHEHDHKHHHHNKNRHGNNIQAFSVVSSKPIRKENFSYFLDLLTARIGPDMLRVKGIINVEGEQHPAIIHGVQHIFHKVRWLDDWPDEDTRTRLVFITSNTKKQQIEGLCKAILGTTN